MSITKRVLDMQQIKSKFLSYFHNKGYTKQNITKLDYEEPLFCNAGMVPWLKWFTGKEPAAYDKMITCQTCIRLSGKHNDLDEIGLSPRHHTSFEMLGHFIFKGANKRTIILELFDFLTNELSIKGCDLTFTYHPEDNDSLEVLRTLQFPCVVDSSNLWSSGNTGAAGLCVEVYYKYGTPQEIEIWNMVFIDRQIDADRNITYLSNIMLDSGAGLERLTAVVNDYSNNYEIPFINNTIVDILDSISTDTVNARIIYDHIKTSTIIITAGVLPGNVKHGYILRKLIRRYYFIIIQHLVQNFNSIERMLATALQLTIHIWSKVYLGIVNNISYPLNEWEVLQPVIAKELINTNRVIMKAWRIIQKEELTLDKLTEELVQYLHDTHGIHPEVLKALCTIFHGN